MKSLNHPHIIKYIGHDIIDDFIYLYMEYMAGGSIYSVIEKYGALNEDTIRAYAI